jgi:hypothetical protein
VAGYSYRVRFDLPKGDHFRSDEDELLVLRLHDGKEVRLRSGAIGSPLSQHSTASIVCGSFGSELEARAGAELVRDALLLWATIHKLGVDTGDGHVRSTVTDVGREWLEAQLGKPVRNDIQGIDVYSDEEPKTVFVRFNAEGQLAKNPGAFVERVAAGISEQWRSPDKLRVAMELFSSSFFDGVFRSRFLTLVTAVEALVVQDRRGASVQALLDGACKAVGSLDIEDSAKDSLRSGLERLRDESIGGSAAKLIGRILAGKEYGGLSADRFFRKCYDIRSQTVHDGRPHNPDVDFLQVANQLQELVADLLVASVEECATQQGIDVGRLLGSHTRGMRGGQPASLAAPAQLDHLPDS